MPTEKNSSITHGRLTWHDYVSPTPEELAELQKKYGFHDLDKEDVLTENQRPKIDEYDDYLFIVLHFPVLNSRTKRITTEEVDIFIGSNFIITLHEGELDSLADLREACTGEATRKELLSQGTGYFLYRLTKELFDYCFPLLDSLWRSANRIEKAVFDTDSPQDLLRDIMILKKNIITFRRILSTERSVISALEYKNKKFLPESLEVYFDDVVDKAEKLWSSLESLKEVTETIQDANESLISHTTGNTIRILTVFSVVMLPLTLISGIFGMNVAIPGESSPYMFLWIGGGMLAVAVGMVAYFRWRDWL
jgi:magnesium transporter